MNRAITTSVITAVALWIGIIVIMSIVFGSTLLAIGPALAVSIGVGMAVFFSIRPTSRE